jgi:hypothetical protein
MARYYFHTREGDDYEEDKEGIDLPSIDAVRKEAILAAREMVAELVLQGSVIDGKRFEVTDEGGNLVAEIPFLSVIK